MDLNFNAQINCSWQEFSVVDALAAIKVTLTDNLLNMFVFYIKAYLQKGIFKLHKCYCTGIVLINGQKLFS